MIQHVQAVRKIIYSVNKYHGPLIHNHKSDDPHIYAHGLFEEQVAPGLCPQGFFEEQAALGLFPHGYFPGHAAFPLTEPLHLLFKERNISLILLQLLDDFISFRCILSYNLQIRSLLGFSGLGICILLQILLLLWRGLPGTGGVFKRPLPRGVFFKASWAVFFWTPA